MEHLISKETELKKEIAAVVNSQRQIVLEKMYHLLKQHLDKYPNVGLEIQKDLSLVVVCSMFTEFCATMVANHAFLNKKSDVWAQSFLEQLTNIFADTYRKEIDHLTTFAEDDDGNVILN